MKAVILARVSTLRQEKEGLSLKDIQLPKLRDYAEEQGFEVAQEFVFSESADQKIRRKFSEMLKVIKQNKSIKVLIAFRVDRITRNFRDAVLIDDLIKNYGKEIHFVDDRLVINNDSTGRDIQDWDLKVFLGKQFINRLKEDAKKSADHKLSKGEWPGPAPYGYKNIDLDKKQKWIEPDKEKAPIVKKIYEWYSSGTMSIASVRKKLKDEYSIKISQGTMDGILKNKFYIGMMNYNGVEYPHLYERLIPWELFESVQKRRDEKRNGPPRKMTGLPFLYRGLMTCAECGCAITGDMKKKKYIYYKCTEYNGKHGAKYVKEADITKQVVAALKNLKVSKPAMETLLGSLKESHEGKKQFQETMLNQLNNEYARLKNRIEQLYDDKLDGNITEEEYKERNTRYRQKQSSIEYQLEKLREADEDYYQTVELMLKVAVYSREIFESSNFDEKRQIANIVLSNLKLKGDKLVYDYHQPFNLVAKYVECSEWHAG